MAVTTPTNTSEFEQYLAQELLIESVTEKLLELMEREDVSKAELARRLGKSRAYITQILDGSRNMTLRTVADVAHAIGFDVHLAEGTGLGHRATLATVGEDQITEAPATSTAAQRSLADEMEEYVHAVCDALRGTRAQPWQSRATFATWEVPHGQVIPIRGSMAADERGRYSTEEVEVSA